MGIGVIPLRVIMNTNKGFNKIQYSIYKHYGQELSAFPDTSFTIESNMSAAVMVGGVVDYDLTKNSFGELGVIDSYKDASPLRLSGFDFNEVRVMNISLGDDSTMELTIDSSNKLVIQAKKFVQGELVETCRLISMD